MADITHVFTDIDNDFLDNTILNIIFNHVKDMVFIMKVEEGPRFRYEFANETGLSHAGMTKACFKKPSMKSYRRIELFLFKLNMNVF